MARESVLPYEWIVRLAAESFLAVRDLFRGLAIFEIAAGR
jgi:hypothetical protein